TNARIAEDDGAEPGRSCEIRRVSPAMAATDDDASARLGWKFGGRRRLDNARHLLPWNSSPRAAGVPRKPDDLRSVSMLSKFHQFAKGVSKRALAGKALTQETAV